MPTDDAVIITALRTPVGRARGQFASIPAWTLGEIVVREAVARAGIDPVEYEDVIIGETIGGGGNAGRYISLAAGVPREVPGFTVVRACATGLEAVTQAALNVWAGTGEA
jgi:acetyl-CoA C-acetyltransferase